MRISDWSSDVCSSDLIELVDGGDARLDPAQHHAHLIALIEARHAEAANAGHADREVAFVGFLELLTLRRCHHVQHQIATLLWGQRTLRDRRDLAVDLHRRRSEEHTSELQSLMRFSYAVFCLQKRQETNTTEH